MTDSQWHSLLQVLRGERSDTLPVGIIVDSPWLPGWAGVSMLDYFSDDQVWLQVNQKAVTEFPDILFLPGFWAEFGMCTEPSAFGAKCIWPENTFPSVEKSLYDYSEIGRVRRPNCRTDGLPPFVLRRLQRCRGPIEAAGHRIRFATARGPLNIASYLLGHTEFLVGLKTHPEEIHRLLTVVTDFLVDWINCQADAFDSIDGIFLLDDLVGFLGNDDFQEFALPYLKRIYDSRDVSVRFLHNDAFGLVTARHLAAMGVNLFNFSFQHSISEMRAAAGPTVALLGNIPPRDVLALGTPDDVRRCMTALFDSTPDRSRWIVSCGGGASPGMTSEHLHVLYSTVTNVHSCIPSEAS